MQHLLKFIYLCITFILFMTTPIWAITPTDLACADVDQNSTGQENWKCPGLGSKLDATLSDLDVETGHYTCEYRYPDTQQVATSCTYFSTDYRKDLNATLNKVHQDLKGSITTKTGISMNRPYFYQDTIGLNYLALFSNPNSNKSIAIDPYVDTVALEKKIIVKIKDTLAALSDYYTDSVNSKKHGYLDKLKKGSGKHQPSKALKDSYKNFVEPYSPNASANAKDSNRSTFSHFVTGLVTLNTDVVDGYDERNGTLVLGGFSIAENKALKKIGNFLSKESNRSAMLHPDSMQISGWINIFQQKIWGFYYNLQRRLDLGYDIISTQLLFIMMVFFSMMMAVRGGARYIINRENGESSGEIKINEASIMKTLGILATVFAFYISVPVQDKSMNLHGTKVKEEIRTNASLSKELIRMAMMKGADFATMISDLGTDAFLRYVVQQQGAYNGLYEGDNVIKSIMSLVYYYPAYEVVNACRYQTGLSDDRILSGEGSVAISPKFSEDSKNYASSSKQPSAKYNFYSENNITLISDALCQKMISQTAHTLPKISSDIDTLMAMINDDKFLRMDATYNLVENHVLLQKELGWMNIASIPYTYFMMKNYHLFYTSTIDYAAIEANSTKYAKNLGLRGGKDAIDSTLWIKDITKTKERLALENTSDKEDQVKHYTRLAVYNFLPGFSGIRNEVLQRMQSLFSDILRMRRAGSKDIAALNSFSNLLSTMMMTAKQYYGKIDNLFDISTMQKNLEVAVGADGGKGDPIKLHQLFYKISYLVAMGIWKSGFIIVFLSAIAMVIGLKIVMYIIAIMVHFFISPFIVVWAFATSSDLGATKIKNYLRDTLIYMLYPTIIVIGVFMFIFAYELFYSIYGFITSMLIEGQTDVMENMATFANANASNKDIKMGFLTIYALRDITEILIDLLSVYVAFLTINKFPELVLKMMGVGDSATIMLPQATEAIQNKGGGSVSPLSR